MTFFAWAEHALIVQEQISCTFRIETSFMIQIIASLISKSCFYCWERKRPLPFLVNYRRKRSEVKWYTPQVLLQHRCTFPKPLNNFVYNLFEESEHVKTEETVVLFNSCFVYTVAKKTIHQTEKKLIRNKSLLWILPLPFPLLFSLHFDWDFECSNQNA